MYLCYHDATQARFQGPGDLARFVEGCKKTGTNAALFADARQIGPLATFSCAHSWVDHPYRDGVALVGDSATSSDPTHGQGLSLTLRDARVLRDHLMCSDDWDAAGHAYADEHDGYAGRLHTFNQWLTEMYLATGPDADAAVRVQCRSSRKIPAASRTRCSAGLICRRMKRPGNDSSAKTDAAPRRLFPRAVDGVCSAICIGQLRKSVAQSARRGANRWDATSRNMQLQGAAGFGAGRLWSDRCAAACPHSFP